jgi:glycosyltransferase involved in cell wall biosynthesis
VVILGRQPVLSTAIDRARTPDSSRVSLRAGPNDPAPGIGITVSIVIPTRNRGSLIRETLDSLRTIQYTGLEILVIDQSTDDRTALAVTEAAFSDPRIIYRRTDTVGSAAGRNLGASISTADVIAYTDDDCVVSDGWLAAIITEFHRPDTAAVYGRLLPYEHRQRTGTDVGFKADEDRTEYSQKTPPWYIGHGGNMAFRRADLLRAGGFDPLLGAGGVLKSNEDPDIAYRLLAAHRRIVYAPGALAFHRHWKDWDAQKRMERAYGIGAGAQFSKYLRCRDPYALRLLATWMWQLGVRRLGAGLLKWRSRRVMYLGYCQLVYPWLGIWAARRYRINRRYMTYIDPKDARSFSLVGLTH